MRGERERRRSGLRERRDDSDERAEHLIECFPSVALFFHLLRSSKFHSPEEGKLLFVSQAPGLEQRKTKHSVTQARLFSLSLSHRSLSLTALSLAPYPTLLVALHMLSVAVVEHEHRRGPRPGARRRAPLRRPQRAARGREGRPRRGHFALFPLSASWK